MSLTINTRNTAVAGAALLAAGLTLTSYGAVNDNLSHSLMGVCLVIVALTAISAQAIKGWITDVRDERRDYAHARRDADGEQRKYFAARASLEGELARLARDTAAERARLAATLISERRIMEATFEEERLQLTTEAFRTGVEMERAGMLKPDVPLPTNLIPFPGPQRQPEQERSREHGVVGP